MTAAVVKNATVTTIAPAEITVIVLKRKNVIRTAPAEQKNKTFRPLFAKLLQQRPYYF